MRADDHDLVGLRCAVDLADDVTAGSYDSAFAGVILIKETECSLYDCSFSYINCSAFPMPDGPELELYASG